MAIRKAGLLCIASTEIQRITKTTTRRRWVAPYSIKKDQSDVQAGDWIMLSQNFDAPYLVIMQENQVRPINGKIAGVSAKFNSPRELCIHRVGFADKVQKPYSQIYCLNNILVYIPPDALFFRYKAIKENFLYQAATDIRRALVMLMSQDLSLTQEQFSLWDKSKKLWAMANNAGTPHEGHTAMLLACKHYEKLFHNLTYNLYANGENGTARNSCQIQRT